MCGNELVYYGIHALSMIYAVLGKGAVSAINVGQPGSNIARIRFADHRDVTLLVAEKEWMPATPRATKSLSRTWKRGLRFVMG